MSDIRLSIEEVFLLANNVKQARKQEDRKAEKEALDAIDDALEKESSLGACLDRQSIRDYLHV